MELKKILIINFTRMGDLIESTSLFKKVKTVYPDSFVTLLVLPEFYEICEFFDDIDEIITFDITNISGDIFNNNYKFSYKLYKSLEDFLNKFTKTNYEVVFNLTHDIISSYFMYLLKADKFIGFSRNREGDLLKIGEIVLYFIGAAKIRKASCINLVDIYKEMLPQKAAARRVYLNTSKKPDARESAKKILTENGVQDNNVVISFAIGASSELKKWKKEYFLELAKLLIKYDINIKILILGAKYDKPAGDYIKQNIGSEFNDNIIDLTGKTSVSELVNIVEGSHILITNDTGTMHIAAGVVTDIIVLYTGQAGYFETGPYAENQVLVLPDIPCFPCDFGVKCNNFICADYIKPDNIFEIIKLKLEQGLNRENLKDLNLGKINLLISKFDKFGFMDYVPLKRRRLSFDDLKLRIFKLSMESVLNKNAPDTVGKRDIREILDNYSGIDENIFDNLDKLVEVIGKMINFCSKAMKDIKSILKDIIDSRIDSDKAAAGLNAIENSDVNLLFNGLIYDELFVLNIMYKSYKQSILSYDLFGISVDSLKNFSKYKLYLQNYKRLIAEFKEEMGAMF
ncbi:MAG: glycosyltransferase family 9 protein [Deltaproteobacteria bacterium]|jgi:ADP-heptose:LPS heptosyltransferase|nr:glycosyltransferase family 9 protein [Deltaproteobacteria bacterium]MCL5880347.1 glycosyltransferase family 9 protein [Deltaproteobacteria bacterium]MDA8303614.1 glycosyltransferase family 9 protein [Deltaproteobacteria bacterium]